MRRLGLLFFMLSLFCGLMLTASAASADDNWPTWRGPTANGVVAKGNPPVTWSETKNIKWKVEFPGTGSSTPVIWGDKIFLTSAEAVAEEEGSPVRFKLLCLDRRTGGLLWEQTAHVATPHEPHHPTGSFASYSPVTDGQHVWASFGSFGIHCYDVEGNHKWSNELVPMEIFRRFGEGSSPAIAGDAIIVVQDHQGDSMIFAFNKISGELIWKKERDEVTSWTTPLVLDAGSTQHVITSATNYIRAYDAATGEIVWQCSGLGRSVIPTPVVGFGKVYCMSGFRDFALLAIELGRTGDLSDSDAIAWSLDRDTPDVASPLLYRDNLYILSRISSDLSCYKAETGEPVFEDVRLEGLGQVYASPVAVADRIYIAGREGAVAVLNYADGFESIATNTLDDGFDASPVVIGDELYLKGNTYLYCIAQP